VPAPHHGGGPGCGEARDERDVAVEVLRRREAPAPAVDPEQGLVLVAAAVLEARDQPSAYSSRRPGRQVPTSVDQVVSFTNAGQVATTRISAKQTAVKKGRRTSTQPIASTASTTSPIVRSIRLSLSIRGSANNPMACVKGRPTEESSQPMM
jgi:hypothetical protein